jgi:UDP-glucose 4-epimerase
MKILVVGGAGYIGSHMVKMLGQQCCTVTTLDDLSNGHRDALICGDFVQGNFGDRAILDDVVSNGFDAVMHFASFIQVGESVQYPDKYYRNNVTYTLGLLDAMRVHGVNKYIFSSTATTFGEPLYTPMDERHPQQPINPYGRTKLMVEQALADYDRAYGFKSGCLRYFNAAGADPEGQLGERHDPETHLIPLVLQAAFGKRPSISVFGRDYDTPDGTCIRDYIHIQDLCSAHWLALESLVNGEDSQSYNLGNGNGFSVQEVIDTAEQVTGRKIPVVDGPRRDGDPARLVADSRLAREKLGWQPQYADLATIIEHAWKWEMRGG